MTGPRRLADEKPVSHRVALLPGSRGSADYAGWIRTCDLSRVKKSAPRLAAHRPTR
ncbi:MAG: hypothetical protein JWM93_1584 [Frankiales bacterium]|nr:hypothetical protein [Frankiales bacterium]